MLSVGAQTVDLGAAVSVFFLLQDGVFVWGNP